LPQLENFRYSAPPSNFSIITARAICNGSVISVRRNSNWPFIAAAARRIKREAPVMRLTRRIGEITRIGDDAAVTVLGVKGGHQLRVGVEEPKSVPVNREEIFERIKGKLALPRE
jgi:carbon storage regulator